MRATRSEKLAFVPSAADLDCASLSTCHVAVQ